MKLKKHPLFAQKYLSDNNISEKFSGDMTYFDVSRRNALFLLVFQQLFIQ